MFCFCSIFKVFFEACCPHTRQQRAPNYQFNRDTQIPSSKDSVWFGDGQESLWWCLRHPLLTCFLLLSMYPPPPPHHHHIESPLDTRTRNSNVTLETPQDPEAWHSAEGCDWTTEAAAGWVCVCVVSSHVTHLLHVSGPACGASAAEGLFSSGLVVKVRDRSEEEAAAW